MAPPDPPLPPPPPPGRWLRPRMRFMFILLPLCFPIVGGPMGRSGAHVERPWGLPLANHDPSALMMAREGVLHPDLRDPGRRHAAPLPHNYRTPVPQACQTVFSAIRPV